MMTELLPGPTQTKAPPEPWPVDKRVQFFNSTGPSGGHGYRCEGRWMLNSVTDLCHKSKFLARAEFDDARERGNFAHDCWGRWLLTGDAGDLGSFAEWIEPLIAHPLTQGCTAVAVEYRMADPRYGLGGSLDAVVRNAAGKLLLIDLKTLSERGHPNTGPLSVQLGGYLSLLGQTWPAVQIDECWALWAKPGSTSADRFCPVHCLTAFEAERQALMRERVKATF